jgi:4-hydroxyphenylpyruvate dioxygenase-like putative hemolysin
MNIHEQLPFLRHGATKLGIVVPDLDRAVHQYHTLFGISPWQFFTFDQSLLRRMTRFGKPCEFSFHAAMSSMGDTRIELVEPVTANTVYAEFRDRCGYGIQHIGVPVDDMAEAIEAASVQGFSVVMEGIGYGLDGDGSFVYLNTEEAIGIMIELIERPKRKHPPQRVYP